jgi:hypothetical protein
MNTEEEAKSQRRAKVAHFPLEILVIALVYAIAYARDLAGCSSTSTAPEATHRGTVSASVSRAP